MSRARVAAAAVAGVACCAAAAAALNGALEARARYSQARPLVARAPSGAERAALAAHMRRAAAGGAAAATLEEALSHVGPWAPNQRADDNAARAAVPRR
jgi:hypothetical protein